MVGSKAKASDKSTRITIDGITPEQFDQLLTLLAQWIRSGDAVVRFLTPSAVKLDFDEDNISRRLKASQLPSGCIPQLRYDIAFMVQGILSGQRKAVASFVTDNSEIGEVKGERKPSKEQIRTEVETRIRYVEEKVVTSDLRRQFAIKDSAKTNTYLSVSWDVVQKRSDITSSILPDLVYATVRIVAQKPRTMESREIFFIPYPIVGRTTEVEDFVVTMTLEDLRELIEKLNDAARALGVAESERRP